MYRYLRFISIFIPQAVMAALVISGVPPEIKKNIIQRIEYKVRNVPEALTDQAKDQLERETIEAIKPYGFFNPKVLIAESEGNPKNIHISVTLNQVAHIKKINLNYDTDVQPKLISALQQSISAYDYAPFTVDILSEITSTVRNAALDAGYYDVMVTRGETSINRYNNLATVNIQINPKLKNRYGEIVLPKGANSRCFSRYHNIKTGETYNDKKIREFQRNMTRSGLFKSSQVKPKPREHEPHIQDIIVEYEDVKPYQYFFGLGLRANLSERTLVPEFQTRFTFNNLGSCGIKQTNSIHIAPGNSIMGQSQLIIPSGTSVDDFSLISLSYNDNNVKAEDFSKSSKLNAMTQRKFNSWEHQLSANLLMEESTLNQNNSYVTTLIYPQYQLLTKAKNKQNSLQFKVKARGGIKSFGSGINFFQLTTSAKLKSNIKHIAIRNRTTYGKIWTEEFNRYPLSMQYFLGGGNSHRGLDYHEINEGKDFFLSRNSLQYRLPKNVLLGGFYDTGYCTHNENYSLNPAAGVLLSYSTSFGSFDLSVGKLLDGSKWVILFHAEPGEELL